MGSWSNSTSYTCRFCDPGFLFKFPARCIFCYAWFPDCVLVHFDALSRRKRISSSRLLTYACLGPIMIECVNSDTGVECQYTVLTHTLLRHLTT